MTGPPYPRPTSTVHRTFGPSSGQERKAPSPSRWSFDPGPDTGASQTTPVIPKKFDPVNPRDGGRTLRFPHAVIQPASKRRFRSFERTECFFRTPRLVVSDRQQRMPNTASKPSELLAIGLLEPLDRSFVVPRSQVSPPGDLKIGPVEHCRVSPSALHRCTRRPCVLAIIIVLSIVPHASAKT